jgi:(p)ppGpp synthase/HD superfamily hydrolase
MNTGKQLLVMPLHAITEVHGEAGLRERLALELERLPPGDREVVRDAAGWAGELHAGQRRTREPYVNHPLRVTLRILCYYHVCDPQVLTAALLHDTVEDQPWAVAGHRREGPAPRREALQVIAGRYDQRVAQLVTALTNPEPVVGIDRTTQYLHHLADAVGAEPWARVIKLSDFTDNGVGIIHTVGARTAHIARKYAPAVAVLRELLERADTPLASAVKDHIGSQLDLAQHRIAAILAA